MSSRAEITHDSHGTIRILVVDADDDTRSRYRQSLKQAGCDVVDAADGREALVKALSHRPTLVITETRLPLFDGYALCEVLRRDSTTRTVPILVVTAEKRPSAVDRAHDAGADAVIIKPVSPEALLKEIQRLLCDPSTRDDPPTYTPTTAVPRRKSLAKAHLRLETTTPPASPPDLVCPSCDAALTYEHSHIGGVSRHHPEQWDYYVCSQCGPFVYRQRTRRLRCAV